MSDPCACGAPGEFLCDALVAPTREQMIERHKAGGHLNGWRPTCDKPICRACRTVVGSMIACTRGGRGKGCVRDTVDFCPDHAPRRFPYPVLGICTHAVVTDETRPDGSRWRRCLLCGTGYDTAHWQRLERKIRDKYRLPPSPWTGQERATDTD